jgi:hypothetical protein
MGQVNKRRNVDERNMNADAGFEQEDFRCA